MATENEPDTSVEHLILPEDAGLDDAFDSGIEYDLIGDTENLPIVLDALRDLYFNGPKSECYIQAVAVYVNILGGT